MFPRTRRRLYNDYVEYSFIIDKRFTALMINGKTYFATSDMDYMALFEENPDYQLMLPFGIDTGSGAEISIRSMSISELDEINELPQYFENMLKDNVKQKVERKKRNIDLIKEINECIVEKNKHVIELKTLKRIGTKEENSFVCFIEGNVAFYLYNSCQERRLETEKAYALPLKIDLVVSSARSNITIEYGNGAIILRMWWNMGDLFVVDFNNGNWHCYPNEGGITANEYHDISWIINRDYMALIEDGDVRLLKILG